ncbi:MULTISPECIES: phage tail tape measure protein [Pseudomonas]|uniref:phage tail tape measure protein n=1 Tax=Pseudomonas TaxID=286 RepID=UPI001BE5D092|nr:MULTISPECIES: phage tail tape measure protein [Pseudomonas]MBT2339451.1 phage tail tape measure protein [Pseudomonas fluorescens]MCD4529331.1 phage tail tape measure protein [Pseudomonas sp. C3-2018]
MANDLKLRVLLNAIDQASGPLKAINRGSIGAARALKEARDRLKGLNAQQKDISAWRTQRAAAEQTEKALGAAREKVRALTQQFTATGAPTKAMAKNFHAAVRAANALKQQHASQQSQLHSLRTRLNSAAISTRNLSQAERELRTKITSTNGVIHQQENRLRQATNQQKRLAAAKTQYEKSKSTVGNMARAGAAGVAGGSGILYAGSRMIAPGLTFDASMSKVQALTRLDKDSPQLKALRDQARQLGASTQFTAGQAADAQGFLGMAGFDPKAIKDAMPGMLDLAKAGGAELAETADIASNILTGLNLKAADMGRVGDILVGTFTRSNTNLQMLGETMKYVAPVASSVGQDIETVAAMAGKLGDAGIQGSMGGTALRAILNRLSSPPKAAAKALAQLGISTKDAQGNMRQMPEILTELYKKTRHLGNADRAGLLKHIAGEEAVSALQVLVKQAGTGELQTFIGTLRQAQGEAGKTAKVMADNLAGDLSALNSAWEDLGIQMQEQQNGPMRGLVKSLTEVIGAVKSWIAENPKLAGQIVKGVAGLGALMAVTGTLAITLATVFGPLIMLRLVLAQVGIKLPGLIGMFWKLGKTVLPFVGKAIIWLSRALLMNPIGLALTAIAAAAYLIYRNWDTVRAFFTSAWAEITAGFNSGVGGILRVLADFSPIGLVYRAFSSVMNYLGVEMPGRFTEFGGMIINGLIDGLTAELGKLKGVMGDISDSTIGWFKEKLGIHSPSRVFAQLGGFTMAGLSQGLESGQSEPLSAMTRLAKQLTAAGTLVLGAAIPVAAMALPQLPEGAAALSSLSVDDRAPISQSAAPVYNSQDSYQINIHPTPGMDPQAISRAVRAELARIASEKGARQRSKLSDLE